VFFGCGVGGRGRGAEEEILNTMQAK